MEFSDELRKTLVIGFLSLDKFHFIRSRTSEAVFRNQNIFLLSFEKLSLKNLVFSINSQVYTFYQVNETIEVTEHYNIGNQSQTVRKIGTWNNSRLFLIPTSLLERRQNLNGLTIRAETMPESPWMLEIKGGKIQGMIGDFWHGILEPALNFTTSISSPPDFKWGSLNDDGSWSGMVGGLLEERIDIALASLFKTVTRGRVIDFSVTFDEATTGIFIKFPKRKASWTTFLDPFHIQVWLAWILLLIVIILSFFASYHLGPERIINRDFFTFSQAPFIVLCSSLGQGSSLEPKSMSSKIIFILSFFLGVMVLASLNATLTSHLAVFKLSLPFTNLEGILETDFTFGGIGNAIYDDIFHAPLGSIKRKIADKIVDNNRNVKLETYEQAHKMILEENFAYVSSIKEMNAKNKENCLFVQIPHEIQSFQVALGYPKHFPYAALFDKVIRQTKENGQMDRILKKWVVKPRSDCVTGTGFESMGLANLILAFAVIAGGLLVSLLVLTLEIYKNTFHPANRIQLSQENQTPRRPQYNSSHMKWKYLVTRKKKFSHEKIRSRAEQWRKRTHNPKTGTMYEDRTE